MDFIGRKWNLNRLNRIGFFLRLLAFSILFALGEGNGTQCGNGILEPGEQCDCGTPEQCTDPCCRALVCQLKENAECSNNAPCCKNCKFKQKWEVCREAVKGNECDLSEFCSGASSLCPPDVFHSDYKNCSLGQGYCYKGYCRTHEEQCKLIYKGQAVTAGTLACYKSRNTQGNEFGHCGERACLEEDVLCGSLQCRNVNVKESSGGGGGGLFPTIHHSHPLDETLDDSQSRESISDDGICPNFGTTPLVLPQTKCGHGKVCVNQRCVNITSLNVQGSCPSNSTDTECSGHGDCTSRFSCLCRIGWGGSDCSKPEAIVHVKFVGTTIGTPRIHDIPVTRTESQGIITHKGPEYQDYTNYTLGIIFAVVVVGVSIVCFLIALVYCYFFSSPITKAKENLDSQIDEYTINSAGQTQSYPLSQPAHDPSSSPRTLEHTSILIAPEITMNGQILSVSTKTITCTDQLQIDKEVASALPTKSEKEQQNSIQKQQQEKSASPKAPQKNEDGIISAAPELPKSKVIDEITSVPPPASEAKS